MIVKALFLVFTLYLFSFDFVNGNKKPPALSNTYVVKGILSLPYAELHEPFTAWYDKPNKRSRIDYYDGMVKSFQLGKASKYGTAAEVVPVTTEKITNVNKCFHYVARSAAERITEQDIFPDLTGFKFAGHEEVDGDKCEIWRLIQVTEQKINNYTIFIKYEKAENKLIPVPVLYQMKGYDSLIGSHYDHYYLRYTSYSNEKPKPSVFEIPHQLKCKPFSLGVSTINPMREFIHNDISHIDDAWDQFHKTHKKDSQYKSKEEHAYRKSIFHQNVRYIQSTNRANLGYKLAVNHLADRTSDELKYLRGRKHTGVTAENNGGDSFPYSDEYLLQNKAKLPESIDWRLYGAVTPVKDQAICGSCWSFGTTGTVEGAYFLKHGHLVSLSEQTLVDCSWGFDNNGCDGGNDFSSYKWMMKHGGLPTDAEYGPYLAEDGYCHISNLTRTAKISGFVNVKSGSELALKTALVNHGPISVAIDASHKSFGFYSHGVYYEPKCHSKAEELDHAVLLVGYGVLNGQPYWLIKNSWSNHWGNAGFILMSQKKNNCGVATAPTYVKIK